MNFKVRCLKVVVLYMCINIVVCCKNQTFSDAFAKVHVMERVRRFKLDGCIDKTKDTMNIETMTITGYSPIIYKGSIQNLNKLRILDMSANSIMKIEPGAYTNLSSLKTLILNRNKMQEIKEEYFQNLPLRELYINNNNISHIEQGTFLNTTLKKLELSHNQLDIFTPEWFIESNIEEISITYNKIVYIPGNALQDLQQLIKISFKNNDIANIHKHTFGNTLLYELQINNNALYLFSPNWFIKSNIEILDLSYNYIASIPKRAFRNIQKLISVNFAYNEIISLDSTAFMDAPNITMLDLSNNKIKMLPSKLFNVEHAYHLISLHTNYLAFLSQQLLNNLNTTYITIHTNPWQCACYFVITDWLQQTKTSLFARNRGCARYKNPVCATLTGYETTCREEISEEIYVEYYKTFNFKFCKNILHFKQLLEDGYVSCAEEKRNQFCKTYEKYFPNKPNTCNV